ncbi:hypothetical protein BFG57_07475 [Bacillus solimangrovi]|uniref:Chemotaxis protein n=2 Tax=Bacillus solimangrovi TaxID=1305675 RepID=A0A1E5LKL4_9BACI|nr:hypothetical protein BFG57_07475 [Bacillus solimangrovi]
MKDISIKVKLLITILILTLVPLMTSGYLSHQMTESGIYKLSKQDLNYIVSLKADQLSHYNQDKDLTNEEQQKIKEHLDDMVEQYYKPQGSSGYGYIVDSQGTMLFHPNPELIGSSLADYEFMKTMMVEKTGYIEYEWEGKMKVAAYKGLANGNIFAASTYLEEMMLPAQAIKNEIFLISIIGSLLALFVGVFIINQITKPINSVVSAMKKAEDGDLTVEVPIYSNDEVGKISVMYNSMIQRLKGILYEIHEASHQVAASSEELTASANENTRASEQIAMAAEEISRSSRDQVERVSAVVHSIHDISDSISLTTKNVNKVKIDSETASKYAQQGSVSLKEVVGEMSEITEKVKKTETVIRQLGSQSKSIMGIITTISDISEQTNLLALNAAIEAARAGEQGKSFAVVAEEVRRLAEQSRISALEITELITTIHGEIHEATEMMEQSSKAVSDGGTVVSSAGESFARIESSICNVNEEMESLDNSIKRINNDAVSIVENSDEISNLAEVSSGDTEEVAAASEEQMATMEEINSASQVLANMADQLQEQVNQFKVM